MDLKWLKSSEYSIKSDCGIYHIAKTLHDNGDKYTLWEGMKIIGHWKTPAEAKQKAEELKKISEVL
jgi:hypothetical protein